jgi:hypothetical protein
VVADAMPAPAKTIKVVFKIVFLFIIKSFFIKIVIASTKCVAIQNFLEIRDERAEIRGLF